MQCFGVFVHLTILATNIIRLSFVFFLAQKYIALVTAAGSIDGNGEDNSTRFQGPPVDRKWFARHEMKISLV